MENDMETLFYGSSGPNVKLIQSLLNRIGYNAGPVDGVIGYLTWQAVMAFQRNNGLNPDGVVGQGTWNIFDKFLRGYDIYTVRPGDSLYNIARRYYTTLNAILTANPGIDPDTLMVGQQIIVPYGLDIVYTDINYTYEILERQIQGLRVRYPFIETGVAGNSVMGKNLYYIRLGRGSNQVSYNATQHANEGITTLLLMKFIENLAKAYSVGGTLGGYSVPNIWQKSSLYIVPLVNPDGLDLVNYWPNYTNPVYQNATALNNTGLSIPSVWKANIRGVDLNLNYPADWDEEHEFEIQQGITGPAPRDYGGPAPLSEPESASMVNFTRQHDFRLVISYHTQGEVIYYQFEDFAPPDSLTIAQLFSRVSGYTIYENPEEASRAGYKDWFIQEYNRPGFTIEVGKGVNPIPVSQFPTIYQQNEEILLLGALV